MPAHRNRSLLTKHDYIFVALSALQFVCVGAFSSIYPNQFNNQINNGRFQNFQIHAEVSSSDAAKDRFAENRLMIFGLGNVGALVAKRSTSLINDGLDGGVPFFRHVYGRSSKEISGVKVIDFDAHQELEEALPFCTHILVTIPPVDPSSTNSNSTSDNATLVGGRPRRWEYFCDPVLNHPNFSFRELVPANTWVGYISSTSVYGNHDGEWVTEESEVRCKPGSKAELYLRAENEWRSVADECNWRLHVFRSSGLYGDNRSAIHTIRKKGISIDIDEKVIVPDKTRTNGEFPTSRIHEEDVSRAILSAMKYDEPAAGHFLWNLADDNPAPRSDVMAFGTALLKDANLLPRENLEGNLAPRALSSERERRRSTDRKRVSNHRLKDQILPDGKLIYPTYREGLRAVLDRNREGWSTGAAPE